MTSFICLNYGFTMAYFLYFFHISIYLINSINMKWLGLNLCVDLKVHKLLKLDWVIHIKKSVVMHCNLHNLKPVSQGSHYLVFLCVNIHTIRITVSRIQTFSKSMEFSWIPNVLKHMSDLLRNPFISRLINEAQCETGFDKTVG